MLSKIIFILVIAAAFAAIILLLSKIFISPVKRAGNRGEKKAARQIKRYLKKGDKVLRNVKIRYDGKKTELDLVIVNRQGVSFIEVKNFNGRLYGNEDDFEWEKYKTTDSGNVYRDKVKNPLRQVKRQEYILANYLRDRGINVWVRGYVLLLNSHSPVENSRILSGPKSAARAVHGPEKRLDDDTVLKIVRILG